MAKVVAFSVLAIFTLVASAASASVRGGCSGGQCGVVPMPTMTAGAPVVTVAVPGTTVVRTPHVRVRVAIHDEGVGRGRFLRWRMR